LSSVASQFSSGVEFCARLVLVNCPSYALAKLPAIDKVCQAIFAYLLFQVVGFNWAILVNASFALACQLKELIRGASMTQLVLTFYIYYASLRVIAAFAVSSGFFGMQSLNNFPVACDTVSKNKKDALSSGGVVFLPLIALEIGLLLSDVVCPFGDSVDKSNGDTPLTEVYIAPPEPSFICKHTGLHFLTSNYIEVRRLLFYSLVTFIIQLYQTCLLQFPSWEMVLQAMRPGVSVAFQASILVLVVSTITSILSAAFLGGPLDTASTATKWTDGYLNLVLFGWTAWLYLFFPFIVKVHGEDWVKTTSVRRLQVIVAHIRISQIAMLAALFGTVTLWHGYLRAQLDLTLLSMTIPALYVVAFLWFSTSVRVDRTLQMVCVVASILVASILHETVDMSGQGSVLLVFFHLFSRFMDIIADDYDYDGPEKTTDQIEAGTGTGTSTDTGGRSGSGNSIDSEQGVSIPTLGSKSIRSRSNDCLAALALSTSTSSSSSYIDRDRDRGRGSERKSMNAVGFVDPDPDGDISDSGSDSGVGAGVGVGLRHSTSMPSLSLTPPGEDEDVPALSPPRGVLAKSLSGGLSKRSGMDPNVQGPEKSKERDRSPSQKRGSLFSLQQFAHGSLARRGMAKNTHVRLSNLNDKYRTHWLVKWSQRNVTFFANVINRVAMPTSLASAIVHCYMGIMVVLSIFLATVSIASLIQENMQVFPTLIDFSMERDSRTFFIDHKIASLTLQQSEPSSSHSCISEEQHFGSDSTRKEFTYEALPPSKLPLYASCNWNFGDLSLLDFALLSEMAYFDGDYDSMKELTSILFPHGEFNDINSTVWYETEGPTFIELPSSSLNITVIAIRGTDVGRLRDIMEDFKLYSEPIVFSLLSGVFPTIRFWAGATTSRIIQILYEMNAFFGLQGEAEYYRLLTHRVEQLASQGQRVVMTGHSLGGGLARIVGALTELPSVTFSPPGLELSHRKYSMQNKDGSFSRLSNSAGALHHQSIAVIIENDIVSSVDAQVGLVQLITCDKDSQAHMNSCHLLEGTICHLLEHCGDPRGRFTSCEFKFDISALLPSILQIVYKHKLIIVPVLLSIPAVVLLAVVPELI